MCLECIEPYEDDHEDLKEKATRELLEEMVKNLVINILMNRIRFMDYVTVQGNRLFTIDQRDVSLNPPLPRSSHLVRGGWPVGGVAE